MQKREILGVGWDVGGWRGKKQVVAVARWKDGRPECFGCSEPFSTAAIPPEDGLNTFIRLAWTRDCPTDVLDRYGVVVAIDAPLGFPVAFQKLVAGGLPPARPVVAEIDNPFAYRDCERHVYKTFRAKKPLSAPFGKLGDRATVALVYARAWAAMHRMLILPFQDAPEDAPVIIEVYPALAKDRKTAKCLEPFTGFIPQTVQWGAEACDACICALMALAFRSENQDLLPDLVGPTGQGHFASEGWIYHPRASSATRGAGTRPGLQTSPSGR